MASDQLEGAARKLWQVAREQTNLWPVVRQDQLRLARRLRERRHSSETFFAGAAAQWDKLRDELYGRSFARQAMLALLPHDAVIADLGCGTGRVAAELAPWVGRVIGVDSSAAMLKAAARHTEGLDTVELRRGDLSEVPVDDGNCDAALLLLVLSYLADPLPVIGEMARIVKPGGKAVVVDLLAHDREDFRRQMGQQVLGFELEEVKAMMAEAGLTPIRAMPLSPEPAAKGPALFLMSAQRR